MRARNGGSLRAQGLDTWWCARARRGGAAQGWTGALKRHFRSRVVESSGLWRIEAAS